MNLGCLKNALQTSFLWNQFFIKIGPNLLAKRYISMDTREKDDLLKKGDVQKKKCELNHDVSSLQS